MVENNMLPALCFVLSRKQLEVCAKEITTDLLEFDSKVGYTIQRECEQIIRKLPNHQEYLHLPEYVEMVKLLEKGIAIHHSGVMPVLKEMVEILYAKGYIKLLFATETFSIGVNMPTKTVVFTNSTKFDGNTMRNLYSHEYTQMAGRAGRRGLDKVGHVFHLFNLYDGVAAIGQQTLKSILGGAPQTLRSKYAIGYDTVLNVAADGGGVLLGLDLEGTGDAGAELIEADGVGQAFGVLTGFAEFEVDDTEVVERFGVDVLVLADEGQGGAEVQVGIGPALFLAGEDAEHPAGDA
jgi:hypothetical protein